LSNTIFILIPKESIKFIKPRLPSINEFIEGGFLNYFLEELGKPTAEIITDAIAIQIPNNPKSYLMKIK
jgi:hypothetical protein